MSASLRGSTCTCASGRRLCHSAASPGNASPSSSHTCRQCPPIRGSAGAVSSVTKPRGSSGAWAHTSMSARASARRAEACVRAASRCPRRPSRSAASSAGQSASCMDSVSERVFPACMENASARAVTSASRSAGPSGASSACAHASRTGLSALTSSCSDVTPRKVLRPRLNTASTSSGSVAASAPCEKAMPPSMRPPCRSVSLRCAPSAPTARRSSGRSPRARNRGAGLPQPKGAMRLISSSSASVQSERVSSAS